LSSIIILFLLHFEQMRERLKRHYLCMALRYFIIITGRETLSNRLMYNKHEYMLTDEKQHDTVFGSTRETVIKSDR